MLLFDKLLKQVSLQYAALGQIGLQFQPEPHDVTDSAREDIRCCVNGRPLEPSEIMPRDCKPATYDPNGIHSNKEGLSKVRLVSQAAFWPWRMCAGTKLANLF